MLQKAGGLFQLLSEVDFGTSFGIKSLYLKSRSSNLATHGFVRMANDDLLSWRNNANDGDLDLTVDADDALNFNGTAITIGGNPVQEEITVTDTATIDLNLDGSNDLTANIVASSITNAMISNSAAIAYSKLNLSGSIVNADINASAAIAYSKLNLSSSIVNNDISASAAIANSKLAQMATLTIKGNNTGGSATPSDLTATQVTAMLNDFVGDSGSGGTKGLVPAPATGDAAAGKFLKADGSWVAPTGSGDVVGPASSTDNGFAKFDGLTGKLLKNSAATISNSDVDPAAAIAVNKLAAVTASRALVSDGSGFISAATTTATEIGYVNGVTSSIQTQLGTKMTNPMTTGGDIIYGGASGVPARLGNGSAGQLLTSSGSTSAPTWTGPQIAKVSKSGTQTFSTETKLTGFSTTFDSASLWDNTNNRMVIAETGYYGIILQMYASSVTNPSTIAIGYKVNGGTLKFVGPGVTTTATIRLGGSATESLSATNTIEYYIFTSASITIAASEENTFFSIYKIR